MIRRILLGFFLATSGLNAFASFNLLGGSYTSQADAGLARSSGATSPFLNPAGLALVEKDEISSGASSFNLLEEDLGGRSKFTSSSNHVSWIKSVGDYQIGLMIYTINSSFDHKTTFRQKNDTPSSTNVAATSTINHADNNLYIFSFAPKGSNFGFGLNLLSANNTFSERDYKHVYSAGDVSSREYKSASSETTLNILATSLTLGWRARIGLWNFAASVESPAFVISNNSKISINSVSTTPNGGNDINILNFHADSKLANKSDRYTQGNLRLGAARVEKAYEAECDISIIPAQPDFAMELESDVETNFWMSSSDSYQKFEASSEGGGSSNYKSAINPSCGYLYKKNDIHYGVGAAYRPSSSKEGEGVDEYLLTAGATRFYKNYKGNVTFQYLAAKDAGRNLEFNQNAGESEEVDYSYQAFGLVFSGSYYF